MSRPRAPRVAFAQRRWIDGPTLPVRLLAWALGAWSPSLVLMGRPPYYSLRGALVGRRDAWVPPRWALDERSPNFSPRAVDAADWHAAQVQPRTGGSQ